jgi:hypothetical protein
VSGDVPKELLLPENIEKGRPVWLPMLLETPRELTGLIEKAECRPEVTRNAAL